MQDALAMRILDVEFFDDNGTKKKARLHPKAAVTRAMYANSAAHAYLGVPFPVD